MKILFITSSLSSGGAERVLSTLANHWSTKNWDVEVFLLSNKDRFYPLNSTIKVHISQHYYNNPLNYIRQLYDIRSVVNSSNFDIIISFLDLMNIFTLLATIGIKTPLVISERNHHETLKSKFWRFMRRITYPFTDGMVLLSDYDFQKYHYVQNKRIIVNPLDVDKMENVNFNDKEKIMIAVGNLHPQKGFDLLLQALKNIKMKEWKFLILGEGEEREKLSLQIKQYHLENAVFLMGKKNNIFDYYKKASIFVLSSRYEGFPNVLNEAMAHGCSSVAFNCKTGPKEIIQHGENGFLIEENNIQSLKEHIELLMLNEKKRKDFFSSSIKIREKNSLESIANLWEVYLKELKDTHV